jgi:anti-sigma-K factor RskA
MDAHDLTAAYALDALDPDEVEAYERHLGQCEQCREQLAELNETAGALAFGSVAPAPPPRLRAVILETAAAERTNVVPLLRRPWVARGLAVAAAAAACIVVGFVVASLQSSHTVSWTVNRDAFGNTTLQVSGLSTAPRGKTYEAWVIPKGGKPKPAALFSGGAGTTVQLQIPAPRSAVVAVTVERAGGTSAPTTKPIFSAPA